MDRAGDGVAACCRKDYGRSIAWRERDSIRRRELTRRTSLGGKRTVVPGHQMMDAAPRARIDKHDRLSRLHRGAADREVDRAHLDGRRSTCTRRGRGRSQGGGRDGCSGGGRTGGRARAPTGRERQHERETQCQQE